MIHVSVPFADGMQLGDFGLARHDDTVSDDCQHHDSSESDLGQPLELKRSFTKHVVTRWYRCVAPCHGASCTLDGVL